MHREPAFLDECEPSAMVFELFSNNVGSFSATVSGTTLIRKARERKLGVTGRSKAAVPAKDRNAQ